MWNNVFHTSFNLSEYIRYCITSAQKFHFSSIRYFFNGTWHIWFPNHLYLTDARKRSTLFFHRIEQKNLNLLFERSKTKSDVFTVNIITIRLEILKNAGFRLFVYLPFLLALSIKAFFQSWRRVRNIVKNSESFEKNSMHAWNHNHFAYWRTKKLFKFEMHVCNSYIQ